MMRSDLRTARLRGQSARSVVHERLRREIVELALPPGTPLSEAEIAARFSVSRTPVRESLILLAEEGLVDIYPQRGTFVGPIRFADVMAAQFVRESLECSSLPDAIGAARPEDIDRLRLLLDRQDLADRHGDAEEFFALDEEFHEQLMAVGGHRPAWRFVAQAKAQMDRARRLSLPGGGKMAALVVQHRQVVDAIEAADTAAAVAALRAHLREVLDDVARIQREQPELFDQS